MRKAMRTLTLVATLFAIVGLVGVFASGGKEGAAAGQKETLKVTTHTGWAAILKPASNDLPVYQAYEKLTNIHIEWENIQVANYTEVMRARLAAGTDLPDILNMAFTSDIGQYGRDGLIIPQEDLIEKYAPNIKKWYALPENQIYKVLDTSPDGHLYGVGGYVLPQFLSFGYLWNKPWLEKLGIKLYPETQADMVAALKAFRDKDPNGNGKKDEIPMTPAAGAGYISLLANQYGFEFQIASPYQVDSSGKVYWAYTHPRMKEYLAFLNMLYSEGLLDKAYATDSWTQTTEKIGNDTVGLIICWATFTQTYSAASKYGNTDGSIPVFVNGPPIAGPTGDKYFTRREIAGGDAMAISKAAKKPEVAMRWIDFIRNSPEALALQNFGIEGSTYKMENGKVVPTPFPGKSFSDSILEVGSSQPPFTHLQWDVAWDLRFPKWSTDLDKSYAKFYKSPSFPMIQPTKDEQDTINKVSTDLNTYRDEMVGKFISGAEPIAKFDEFIAQLKKLGADDLTKVRQQQYDRYLKLTGKK